MRTDPVEPAGTQRDYHERVDPHGRASRLSDVILGGQDGLVNVLGVILGVAAASGSTRVVVVAGLAATFAESVSMAAVAFTSRRAEADRFSSERAREIRHVHKVPELEREEIRAMFRAKGFEGELLEKVVSTITSNEEAWVGLMLREELGLADVSRRSALRAMAIVGVSSFVGSLIPLAPFLFLPVRTGALVSLMLAAAVLFCFGWFKTRWTVGKPWVGALELMLIGTCSALAGYVVGLLLKLPPGAV